MYCCLSIYLYFLQCIELHDQASTPIWGVTGWHFGGKTLTHLVPPVLPKFNKIVASGSWDLDWEISRYLVRSSRSGSNVTNFGKHSKRSAFLSHTWGMARFCTHRARSPPAAGWAWAWAWAWAWVLGLGTWELERLSLWRGICFVYFVIYLTLAHKFKNIKVKDRNLCCFADNATPWKLPRKIYTQVEAGQCNRGEKGMSKKQQTGCCCANATHKRNCNKCRFPLTPFSPTPLPAAEWVGTACQRLVRHSADKTDGHHVDTLSTFI